MHNTQHIQERQFKYLSLFALSSSPFGSLASSLTSEIASISCLLERFSGMLLLVDLGFDRETLIFQLSYLSYLIGYKYAPAQGELSNILILPKLWT